MPSYILGKIELDDALMTQDLDTLTHFEGIREEYEEYSNGHWVNCSLWNASGDKLDNIYRDFDHPIRQTDFGSALPYIHRILRDNFTFDHLKMVRTRSLIDALVIPHRDFVEIDKPAQRFFRVLIALHDTDAAFHSDEEAVFSMRTGEIWFLDAALVHAAANFSKKDRVVLCLDYIFPGDFDPSDIFADKRKYTPGLPRFVVQREPLEASDVETLTESLAKITTRHTFRDMVFLLSKIHFSKDVPVGACYDWLIDIGARCGDSAVVEKAHALREYLIVNRGLGERLSFEEWPKQGLTVGGTGLA